MPLKKKSQYLFPFSLFLIWLISLPPPSLSSIPLTPPFSSVCPPPDPVWPGLTPAWPGFLSVFNLCVEKDRSFPERPAFWRSASFCRVMSWPCFCYLFVTLYTAIYLLYVCSACDLIVFCLWPYLSSVCDLIVFCLWPYFCAVRPCILYMTLFLFCVTL